MTSPIIDWFWSNTEKDCMLWHPEQHKALEWLVSFKHSDPLGAIHIAPQTWDGGRRQNLYVRFKKMRTTSPQKSTTS